MVQFLKGLHVSKLAHRYTKLIALSPRYEYFNITSLFPFCNMFYLNDCYKDIWSWKPQYDFSTGYIIK